MRSFAGLFAFSAGALFCIAPEVALARDVVFISTSDAHYRQPEHPLGSHNDLNRATIEEINRMAGTRWPETLGGDVIGQPRGVLLLGDVLDDGDQMSQGRNVSAEQNRFFLADFGLDGSDGLLKYPVFEGWGNHDGPPAGKERNGFSFQAQLQQRNQQRLAKRLIDHVSTNGLHYSWDWDDVHFVQLNLYPADQQCEGVKYSSVWHNPQRAFSFLTNDLAQKVGSSGRPVVLMSHCGFDTDWWTKKDWANLYQATESYNVVLYLYGHSATGVRDWSPPDELKKWLCINDGQTDKGFFIIQITGNRLRAAYRAKAGLTKINRAKPGSEWGGEWEWKWLVDRSL